MALGNLRDLAVHDLDIGSSGNLGLDKLGKLDAVDRQGTALTSPPQNPDGLT